VVHWVLKGIGEYGLTIISANSQDAAAGQGGGCGESVRERYETSWSGVEWIGVEWSGAEWSGVEWRGVTTC
jgi:hypothetical protein